MSKKSLTITAVTIPTLSLSLVACGSKVTDDQQAVADAFLTMSDAVANADANKMCSVFPPEQISTLEKAGKPCPDIVFTLNTVSEDDKKQASKAEVDAEKITVNGDQATIPSDAISYGDNTKDASSPNFQRIDGKWYIKF